MFGAPPRSAGLSGVTPAAVASVVLLASAASLCLNSLVGHVAAGGGSSNPSSVPVDSANKVYDKASVLIVKDGIPHTNISAVTLSKLVPVSNVTAGTANATDASVLKDMIAEMWISVDSVAGKAMTPGKSTTAPGVKPDPAPTPPPPNAPRASPRARTRAQRKGSISKRAIDDDGASVTGAGNAAAAPAPVFYDEYSPFSLTYLTVTGVDCSGFVPSASSTGTPKVAAPGWVNYLFSNVTSPVYFEAVAKSLYGGVVSSSTAGAGSSSVPSVADAAKYLQNADTDPSGNSTSATAGGRPPGAGYIDAVIYKKVAQTAPVPTPGDPPAKKAGRAADSDVATVGFGMDYLYGKKLDKYFAANSTFSISSNVVTPGALGNDAYLFGPLPAEHVAGKVATGSTLKLDTYFSGPKLLALLADANNAQAKSFVAALAHLNQILLSNYTDGIITITFSAYEDLIGTITDAEVSSALTTGFKNYLYDAFIFASASNKYNASAITAQIGSLKEVITTATAANTTAAFSNIVIVCLFDDAA